MIDQIHSLVTHPLFQRFADQRTVARFFGWLADNRYIPQGVLKRIIRAYSDAFAIDAEEFDFDIDAGRIANFNVFFTRKLKPGARPMHDGIVAPADGVLSVRGRLERGMMIQVKGRSYALDELLGEEIGWQDGSYATIYLSPADYHRFHAPCDLDVQSARRIPGDLLATNRGSITTTDRVYCRNERLVLRATSAVGPLFFIAVGATVVGRARIALADMLTDHNDSVGSPKVFVPPIAVAKGAELGCFEMGSTVIVVFANPHLAPLPRGDEELPRIRVGETLWRTA